MIFFVNYHKQDLYKTSAGEVTPDRIKSALETYQRCVREYGPVEEEGLPLAVNIEKIVPDNMRII